VIDYLIDSVNYILTAYLCICYEVYRLVTNRVNKCNPELAISWKYFHWAFGIDLEMSALSANNKL